MANSAQSRKRARQAKVHRARNASMRSMVRTYIKKVVYAIDAKNIEEATTAYKAAVPVIDRSTHKAGGLHKNKAARLKSRLNARIKALSV